MKKSLNSASTRNSVTFDFTFDWTLAVALAALLTFALSGCSQQALESLELSPSVDAGPPSGSDESEVALVLDGREITIGDLHEHMKDQFLEEFLQQPEQRQFELREKSARDLVQTYVVEAEAKKRGVTPEQLFEDVANAAGEPTGEDVSNWFAENKGRLRGAQFADVEEQIVLHLRNERRGEALKNFLDPKLAALSYRMVISPPRQELKATRLTRGSADAPITIMAFSDYQCPYCIRAEPVLKEVLDRYPGQVRLVHRHFPLDSIHPFARPAAEAAMCADEQGKFWEFHQAIFDLEGRILGDSLAKIGTSLNLDTEKLDQCIEERRFKDFVESDFQTGRAAGVTGTPAFFINGIALSGARDADELSRHVDQELARIKSQ